MISFQIGSEHYELPDYKIEQLDNGEVAFVITEGKFSETYLQIENPKMDENDDELLHYDLFWSDNVQKEDEAELAKISENIIIHILTGKILKEST